MRQLILDNTKWKRKLVTQKINGDITIELQELTLPNEEWVTTWEYTEKFHNLKQIVDFFI
jgi:hypothetical protein